MGSAQMKVNRQGTVLVEGPVSPLVSLGLLVRVGYQLSWTAQGVHLRDKKGRKIAVSLDGGCPEVEHGCAMRMIEEIEQHLHQTQRAKEQVKELKTELLRIIREKSAQGENTLGLTRLWLEKVFPEAPTDLLDRVAAAPETDGAKSPWNRRKRRTLLRAKQGILVNLFAGCSRERFRVVADKNHMALLDIDLEEDLSLDTTFSYLLGLAIQGRVKILLAGPPCRTLSVCRTYPGGPPIVRDRSGPGRWGRVNIPEIESMKVEGDNILILRTMALGIVAQQSNEELRTGDLGALVEQPRDPKEYCTHVPASDLPSLFAMPEWESFARQLDIRRVTLNQGPLGHPRVKPTQLGTNLELGWLEVATKWVTTEESETGPGRSAEWAAWAPGLIEAIGEAIDKHLSRPEARIQALHGDEERMRRHIQNGHQPYWKRCRACVEGRSRDRPHRRQPVADTGALALDLAGPFKTGKDERLPKIRYALAGVFVVADLPKLEQQERERLAKEDKGQDPKQSRGERVVAEEDAEGDGRDTKRGHPDDGAGVWTPEEVLGGEGLAEDLEWCVPDAPEEVADKEGKALERPPDEVTKNLLISLPTKELTFTELLPSKHCSHVLLGIQRMEAQLRSMGFEVKRIHSDKGMEFQASSVQRWSSQRGIAWSTTGADDFRRNGRVEAAIGRIKGLTTTLLHSAKLYQGIGHTLGAGGLKAF